jgi:tripartite-type tricarboxylate transporter receptor subunit TctC
MYRLFSAFVGLSVAIVPAAAQGWPKRPITIVLPLAAGGGSDGLVRVLTPRLGEILGQQIIIENVGGAGGMIGAARIAKAEPDGYEVLLGTSGTNAVNQSIYARPLYNAATDFAPVSLIFEVPLVLITRKDFPASNLKEFTSYAREHQASMQYGSSGVGGTGHLACALLNAALGINVTHIPYRGGGPAMQDTVAGRIDYQCALANIASAQIEGDQVKAIGLMSKDRAPTLPQLPTLHEQGLTDFEASAWNGIFLPKATPAAIVDRLHDAFSEALETPFVRDRLTQLGASVVPPERRSPAYLHKFAVEEIDKWAAIIKAANINPQ